MQRNKVGVMTFAAAIALGACSDSTEPETDPLTEAEATEIASFLMMQSFGTSTMPVGLQEIAQIDPSSPPLALARIDFDETITETADCPLGGSVEVTGTVEGFVDDESGEFEVDATQTQVYRSCTAASETEDFTFTIDSSPSVVSDYYFAMNSAEEVTALGFIEGALDWTSGDRSGRCAIDFQFELDTDGQNMTVSASGTVCNVTLEQNVTVS